MIEIVARAIDAAIAEGANPNTKEGLGVIARVAILAMRRDLPLAVIQAFMSKNATYDDVNQHWEWRGDGGNFRYSWQAAFDAALKP